MRIGTKIMLAMVLSIALSIAGVTVMVSYEVNKALINNFKESSKAQLERMNAFVNVFFDTAKSSAMLLVNSEIIKDNLNSLPIYIGTDGGISGSAQASSSELEILSYMQDLVDYFPMISSTFVANTEGGMTLAPAGFKFFANFDARHRPWYDYATSADGVVLTSAYPEITGQMVCSMVSTVKSASGMIVGVVGIDIRLETLTEEIGAISIGKTGFVIVLDYLGQVVSDRPASDKSTSKNQPWLGKNIKDLSSDVAKALTSLQNTKTEEGISEVVFEDKTWLAATKKTNEDWTIIMLQERDEVFADAMEITMSILMVGIVIFVIMLIVAWLVARSIANPVGELAKASQKVADGDLNAIPVDNTKYKGELGILHFSLKSMVSKLAELIATANEKIAEAEGALEMSKKAMLEAEEAKNKGEQARREGILQTAEDIGVVIDQLSASAQDLVNELAQTEQLTEAQNHCVDTAAIAIGEMNIVVDEVASGTARTATMAEETYQEVRNSNLLVSEVVASMNKIKAQSSAMNEGLDKLKHESESIDVIMNVISDIADQTNLLALNAAIEAARAGEAGRGFAVVADEVRKLAEKTMEATKQVSRVINTIKNSVQVNMKDMQDASAFTNESVSLVDKAGYSLKNIETMVDNTASEIRGIASASEEQAAATMEINNNTQEIHSLMSQITEGTVRSNQAVEKLTDLSKHLADIVNDLRKS